MSRDNGPARGQVVPRFPWPATHFDVIHADRVGGLCRVESRGDQIFPHSGVDQTETVRACASACRSRRPGWCQRCVPST